MKKLRCPDCGLPYRDFGLDTALSDEQWLMIHPENDGNGVLCANCIIRRASKLPWVTVVKMDFSEWSESGELETAQRKPI